MRRGLTIVLCALLAGCAGYAIQKDGEGKGYDIYSPDPYLMRTALTAPGTGEITGFKFDVVWLPNTQKRYRVHSWAGLGKAEFEFNYANGWMLTKVVDKADNTKILESLVDLTKHLIPANPFGINEARTSPTGPGIRADSGGLDLREESMSPVLYRIEFDDVSGCCVGLRPVGQLPTCGQFPVRPAGATAPTGLRTAPGGNAPPPPVGSPASGMN